MGLAGTAYLRALQALGRRLDYGTNVFEREWDVLVVLDACRPDALREVAPEFDFLGEIGRYRSVGSSSSEWLVNTFEGHPETPETAMVSANTWTERYLDAGAFAAVDEVWKYAWDDDHNTVPAGAVTDRAVSLARERDPGRLVVHYMQPHHPFLPAPIAGDGGMARTGAHSSGSNPWILLRRGEVSEAEVWAAYVENVRYVLGEVAALLANVEGRVAITADHGNLFGEWGLYGHPMHTPVPALLAVPWATATATDRHTREPELEAPEPLPIERVYGGDEDGRLAALGYR
jgi:hypothetical protein